MTISKKHEAGRSLTEMMGTLAIMGILAITGIWMYNSAMDRLKANTIINEAQKRAVVVAGQIGFQGRTDPSLGEFSDNEFAGGTFSTDVVTNGLYKQFGIQVSNVPKAICQNILNSIGEGTAIRRLSPVGNPQTSLKSCQEENAFLLVYNNNASPTGGDVIYCDNSNCQTVCGQCVSEDGEQKCVNECPSTGNTCSSNTDCQGECVGCVIPSGQNQGTCQSCQRVTYLQSNGNQWINTGIAPGANAGRFTFDVEVQINSQSNGVVGSRSSDGTRNWVIADGTSSPSVFQQFGYGNTWQNVIIPPAGRWTRLRTYINGDNYIAESIIDGESASKSFSLQTFTNTANIYLFGLNNKGTLFSSYQFKGKIRIVKLYDNGTLVRDFVPVHAPFQPTGKQNCMFDTVSKTLFCSQGSEDFIAGQ